MDRLELIKRNVEEVVNEAELKKLLKEKKNPIVYHGFEPTGGVVHIGYILGINKLIDFKDAGFNVITLFADLHAWLNEKGSLEEIKKIADLYDKSFKVLGLKGNKVVMGSEFQLEKNYIKDIMKLSLLTRIKRARRAMTMIGRDEENPHVAQLLYPLMQVVDMKYLKVDVAFGDMAQRHVHMLARETLPSLDYKSPICIHHMDISGLQGGKMSSSIPESHIKIDEQEKEIRRKINKAYCPEGVIENNPILEICKYIIFSKVKEFKVERDKRFGGDLVFKDYNELEKSFIKKELHPLDLKNSTANYLVDILRPVRKAFGK